MEERNFREFGISVVSGVPGVGKTCHWDQIKHKMNKAPQFQSHCKSCGDALDLEKDACRSCGTYFREPKIIQKIQYPIFPAQLNLPKQLAPIKKPTFWQKVKKVLFFILIVSSGCVLPYFLLIRRR